MREPPQPGGQLPAHHFLVVGVIPNLAQVCRWGARVGYLCLRIRVYVDEECATATCAFHG